MADFKQAIQILQAKVQNRESDYKPAIEAALVTAWSLLSRLDDWWFMQIPEPYALSVVANQDVYKIDKDNVGRLLHVSNQYNRRLWTFKSRRHFLRYRKGTDDATTSGVAVFTVLGLKGGKITIQVYPRPQASTTVYVHYREIGNEANFDRLPDGWLKVLHHLAMSMLAPPKQVNQYRWAALTYKEDEMAATWIAEMQRVEGAASDEEKELNFEDLTADRMAEISELSQ